MQYIFLDIVQEIQMRKPEAAIGKKASSLLDYFNRRKYLNFETIK